MELRCRLCSSGKHLISMFHGKYHVTRDYIRKLIAITTGIEIEQQDKLSQCVCINCCIFTFNFYKFRCTSIRNENKLRSSTGNDNGILSKKSNFKRIANIKLPPEEELFEFMGGWLSTKRNICHDERKTRDPQICNNNNHTKDDKCIATDKLSCNDITTQTNENLFKNVSHTATQTENIFFYEKVPESDAIVQTENIPFIEKVPHQDAIVQTEYIPFIEKVPDQDAIVQTEYIPLDIENEVSDLSNVQCSLPLNSKLSTNKKRTGAKRRHDILEVDIPPQSNSDQILTSVSPIFVKSTNVEICTICDRTIYSRGGLKKHMQTHSQCYVCKKKFATWKLTQNHIKFNCHIRELTKKMPEIHLTKIEDSEELSKQYPKLVTYLHSLKKPNEKLI